ncbi:MAG TPA: tyrosine-type recombinase/integrase [Candidatus Acidoferrales bacterium]|nr:tyrosine-type recombinase/integrase [Candidatus Acidoferrales bacterium]
MTNAKRRGAGEGSIRQRADGRWEGRIEAGWTASGTRRRVSVFGLTRIEAVRKLTEVRQQLARGLPVTDGRTTLGAYLTTWLATVEPRLRPATLTRYRGLCEHQLIPALGHVKLTRLSPADVAAMLARLQQDGLSPRTASHARAVLRTALSDAERWGLLSRNAAKLTDPPRVPKPSPKTLPVADVHRVLDAVAGTPIENLVALGLWTGMRQGELLGLKWADIDMDRAQLTVNAALQRLRRLSALVEPKSEHSRRTLRLSVQAVAALRSERQRQREALLAAGASWRPAIEGLCFTTATGGPLLGTTVTRQFQTALQGAGLPQLRFHHLRHLHGSLLLASGVDLATVSHLLGHSSVQITASTYAGILPTLRDDAVDRLERLMDRQA